MLKVRISVADRKSIREQKITETTIDYQSTQKLTLLSFPIFTTIL